MNRFLSFALAASLLAFITIIAADAASAQTAPSSQKSASAQKATGQEKATQNQTRSSFDDDGDGIMNCQDPDYVRPLDGTGKKLGKMYGGKGGGCRCGYGTGVCDATGPKGKGRGQ